MSSKKPTPPKSKARAKKSANPNSYIIPIILFAVAISHLNTFIVNKNRKVKIGFGFKNI